MSYILDALRRADAERERGAVPGLHSQPGATAPSGGAAGRPVLPAGAWLAGGLALGLLLAGAVGWWLSGRPAATPADSPNRAPAPAVAAASDGVVSPAATATTVPAGVNPSPASHVAMADVQTGLPGGSNAVPPREQVLPRSTTTAPVRVTPAAAPAPSAPGSLPLRLDTAATGTESPAAAPSSGASPIARLSSADRKRLPKLVLGGSMYSDDRASRMLVINDQVVREGDPVAPGVILERIGPHAAELSFEGKRFDLPY